MTAGSRVISAAALEARLDDPSVTILEVSAAPDSDDYARGHIPRARWAYWKELLWDDHARAFPPPDTAARRLGALGASRGGTLVVYGDPVQFGTYALWALTAAGQKNMLVLDGGKEHWVGSGRPLISGHEQTKPVAPRLGGPPDRSAVVARDGVLAAIGQPGQVILDFRAPEEYAGERVSPATLGALDHGAERAGRIPTARHLHYRELLGDDWTFKPSDRLIAALRARGVADDDELIGYCRLSHRASLGWVALTDIADVRSMRVYDGSWTEWGSMVGMPIER